MLCVLIVNCSFSLLYGVPLSKGTGYLSVLILMDTWVVLGFGHSELCCYKTCLHLSFDKQVYALLLGVELLCYSFVCFNVSLVHFDVFTFGLALMLFSYIFIWCFLSSCSLCILSYDHL